MGFFSKSALLLIYLSQIGNVSSFHNIKGVNQFCKSVSGRIYNGKFAKYGQFPYQALVIGRDAQNYSYTCGGALISSEWILTAAHCIENKEYWFVRLGSIFRTKNVTDDGSIDLKAYRGIMHPLFFRTRCANNNDIGLIKLPHRVFFTGRIKPIRLPKKSELSDPLAHICVRVSGWGDTDSSSSGSTPEIMKYADMVTITNTECEHPKSILCAVGFHKESPCFGDSGGPLTRLEADDEIRTLIGIDSFGGAFNCTIGEPEAFTRIVYYLDWIHKITDILLRP